MDLDPLHEKELQQFLGQIERLEIQGATSVAVETLRCIRKGLESMEINVAEAAEYIGHVSSQVLDIRPTEPMLNNLSQELLQRSQTADSIDSIVKETKQLIDTAETANTQISSHAGDIITPGVTVLTHCHSSSATAVLRKAHQSFDIKVYATETRPKYQGRATAQELVDAGIETTQIVDSAVYSIIDEVDLVIVGADAITRDTLYNKIGTSQIAFIAAEKNIPFHVAASLLKFADHEIEIEQRDADEVWADRPSDLRINNPAFDPTPLDHVKSIITEGGAQTPSNFPHTARSFLEEI
jgi:ribose 1,5-bisphosphate isomerase